MTAAVERVLGLVAQRRSRTSAQATPDPAAQKVATPSSSREEAPLSGSKLLRCHKRLGNPREPLSLEQDLAQVDPGLQNRHHCRVLDPDRRLDLPQALSFRSLAED